LINTGIPTAAAITTPEIPQISAPLPYLMPIVFANEPIGIAKILLMQ
jgi:hypothetical protein